MAQSLAKILLHTVFSTKDRLSFLCDKPLREDSQIDAARTYIAGQEEHHRKISFQDEFRQLLRRYEVEFDERYVWD